MKNFFAAVGCIVLAFAVTVIIPASYHRWSLPTPAHAQGRGEPIYCDQFATVAPSTATTTKVVLKVPSGTQRILICGYYIQSTGGTSTLEYGKTVTTACDTSAVTISATYATTVVGSDNASNWRGLAAPNGNDVCIVTGTSTTAAIAIVYYTYGY